MVDRTMVLASDMDGTFIPLDGSVENERDLVTLADELDRCGTELLYVTGRHFALAMEAVRCHALPSPAWLICDVGTSIHRKVDGETFQPDEDYASHLQKIVGNLGVHELAERLAGIAELTLQPPEKQGRFKLSFDCDARRLRELSDRLYEELDWMRAPHRLIASVDPFSGGGLIDLLPRDVSKAFALGWWVNQYEREADAILFAGDSGNDLAALTAGYRSIVVGNAAAAVRDQVATAHREAGWTERLFIANRTATSGVLEGFRHFIQAAKS